MTPIEQLEEVVPMLNALVDRIWFGQMDAPTPCARFTVHDVIDHMIVGAGTYTPLLRGATPVDVKPPVVYGWVPASEFRAAMSDLVDAVRSPGALDRTVDGPLGETTGEVVVRFLAFDGLVHGWDLARATGQQWVPSADLVSAAAAFAEQAIAPTLRDGDTFKEPVDTRADAAPLDRLVAFSGRAA